MSHVIMILNVCRIKALASCPGLRAAHRLHTLLLQLPNKRYDDHLQHPCFVTFIFLQPGSSRRSLVKASFSSFTQSLKVPAGYYTDPGSNIIKLCNDDVLEQTGDAVSYYCTGGLVGSATRTACDAAGSVAGVYTPPDAAASTDCWSLVKPGYYLTAARTAAACPANKYW
jgi:hypothetical protein